MKFKNIFLVFGLSLSMFSCVQIKPVTINGINNFRTENALSKPEFKFDVKVKNPNQFSVTVSRMGVQLVLGDTTLAGINLQPNTRVPALSDVNIPMSLTPSVSTLTGIFMSGIKNMFSDLKKQNMELRGEIVVRKFIFTKKIKIRQAIKL
jgi:LEA14-like dessication related protein